VAARSVAKTQILSTAVPALAEQSLCEFPLATHCSRFLHDTGWTAVDPKPSSNHADKLAARIVTRSFPW